MDLETKKQRAREAQKRWRERHPDKERQARTERRQRRREDPIALEKHRAYMRAYMKTYRRDRAIRTQEIE